jgi:uncharacterized protein with GYD domain
MRFVTLIKFSVSGFTGITQTTTRAKDFVERAMAAGCKIHQLLWTQGRYDGIIVFEAPDVETANAIMLGLASHGNVKTETMVAFDSKEMDDLLTKM